MEPKKTKLALVLKDRSMSQSELIEFIHINYPDIPKIGNDRMSNIVTGKFNNFSIKVAMRISKVLGVTIDEIIEDNINLNEK